MSFKFSKHKKIIIGAIGLIALSSLSAISVVSCSSNRTPSIQQSVEYICGNTTLKYGSSGNLTCVNGGDINGFKSIPAVNANNPLTYDAWNKFYTLQAFAQWSFSLFTSFDKLFSVYTLHTIDNSTLTNNQKQIGVSLATPLGQGYDTYRYGLQSVSFSEPNWPTFNSYINSTNTNPVDIVFNNIQLNFSWWYSSDGSNVIWQDNNFNPNNLINNTANWDVWKQKGILPAQKASLTFNQPITLRLKPRLENNKTTGIFELDASVTEACIGSNNKQQTKKYLDDLAYAYKVSNGDINDVQFADYYQKNKASIDTIIGWFTSN